MFRTTGPTRPTKPTWRTTLVLALTAGLIALALGMIFIARAGATTCQEDEPCWTPLMGDGNGTMYCVVDVRNYQVTLSDCTPIHTDLRHPVETILGPAPQVTQYTDWTELMLGPTR